MNKPQDWRLTATEDLKEGNLVWFIKESKKGGYKILGQVTENIDGSNNVIQTAIHRTNDGVYKRPVLKLAPVITKRKDVFAIKNRTGDVKAEH